MIDRPNLEVAEKLITEGKLVGKSPWCCCLYTESYVFEKLNGNYSILDGAKYPQESYEETKKRRKKNRDLNT